MIQFDFKGFRQLALGGFFLFALADSGWSAPITMSLGSSGGGVYSYNLIFDGTPVSIQPGDSFALTGLSGVTGASVGSPLSVFLPGLVASTTATSATFTQSPGFVGNLNISGTFGSLVVNSSILTLGTVNFSINTGGGPYTGTVQGPVAAPVPEPSSFALLGAGILAICAARRKLKKG